MQRPWGGCSRVRVEDGQFTKGPPGKSLGDFSEPKSPFLGRGRTGSNCVLTESHWQNGRMENHEGPGQKWE